MRMKSTTNRLLYLFKQTLLLWKSLDVLFASRTRTSGIALSELIEAFSTL